MCYLGGICLVFVCYLSGICEWVVWLRSVWLYVEAGILGFFIKRCFVLAQKIYHKGIVQLY